MKSYFFEILTSSRGELSGFAVVLFFLLSDESFIFLSGKGKTDEYVFIRLKLPVPFFYVLICSLSISFRFCVCLLFFFFEMINVYDEDCNCSFILWLSSTAYRVQAFNFSFLCLRMY